MVKKKPFIDKKNASTYHLVRRSNRDVGGYYDEETGEALDVPREFVLMPTPETQRKIDQRQMMKNNAMPSSIPEDQADVDPNDALAMAKMQLTAANLVDDYDYGRHMMPITGSGVFLGADGERYDPTSDIRSKSAPIEPVIKEMDRQLDAIALTTECMDDDIAEALNNYNEDDFEEILDDFCLTAAEEPEFEEGTNEAFDFDAHIERLIEKARMEENGGVKVVPDGHEAWKKQQAEFQGMKPFNKHGDDSDDDDSFGGHIDVNVDDLTESMNPNPGVVAKLNPEEEKALCEKFEQTLLEYDSDEVGDLDEECDFIRGDKPLEGDAQIEAALDHFLQEKKDDNFIIGTRHNTIRSGGGSKVLVNNKMVPFNALEKDEAEKEDKWDEVENAKDVLAGAEEFLANPEVDLPPEEVLIDGKSYFTMKERNPWDCESILSTYSNLDNNPAVIGRSNRRRKKKGKKQSNVPSLDDETIHEDRPVQIMLSNKTGLPLGVLPTKDKDSDNYFEEETFMSVNKGEKRNKKESKEEKRLRKQQVKEERRIARIEKKMMREAIDEEFAKRSAKVDPNDVAGKSVFRYS